MKVLHIIKTKSIDSDGRLLKWIDSLENANISSSVLAVEDDNIEKKYDRGKVSVKVYSLFFRNFFKQRNGYIFKVPEYSLKSIFKLFSRDEEILIFHDVQQYLSLFLILLTNRRGKKIIWDLHELPHPVFFKYDLTKRFLKYILENVDILVFTNRFRLNYVKEKIPFKEMQSFVLNNFPTNKFLNSPKQELPSVVRSWLNNKPYLLWMGLAASARNFPIVLDVFQHFKNDYRMIILGSVDKSIAHKLNTEIDQGYVYQDFVAQKDLIKYIDNAFLSLVFYKTNSFNNTYCEPNRLYQLLGRKIPVVSGNNPPLRKFVSQYNGGIVLDGDGSSLNQIKAGIETVIENKQSYFRHEKNKFGFPSWEEQFTSLVKIIK